MNDDNDFFDKAKNSYNNLQCNNIFEFKYDYARFNLLRKLLVRYTNNEESCIKLIVNHIIILYNVFGVNTTEFLYNKIDKKHWGVIASVVMFLNYDIDEGMEYDEKTFNMLRGM
jgi:hypothetical protein